MRKSALLIRIILEAELAAVVRREKDHADAANGPAAPLVPWSVLSRQERAQIVFDSMGRGARYDLFLASELPSQPSIDDRDSELVTIVEDVIAIL